MTRFPRSAHLAATVAVLAVTAAGCGSSGTNGGAKTPEGAAAPAGGRGGFRESPGSGKVAAVSGSTAQVQGAQSQTAVSWTAKTTFSRQVATTRAALKAGECVVAMPARQSGQSPSVGASSTAGSTAGDTTVAAATVRVVPATNGSCDLGGGQRPGAALGNAPSGAPSGAASGGPSGGPGGRSRGAFGAFGKVTSVSASGFVVSSTRPSGADGSAASGTARAITVTTSSTTKWTTSRPATASAVKVGVCVSSRGRTDSTGAVVASSIQISPPVDGSCTGGFGGPAGGPGASS